MRYLIVIGMVLWASLVWGDYTSTFTNNRNGTVTDSSTSLVWQQGKGRLAKWSAAGTECADSTRAGETDWRLPTLSELEALIDAVDGTNYVPTIDPVFKSHMGTYWSSTEIGTNGAYWAFFIDGYTGYGSKYNNYYVRCVRP